MIFVDSSINVTLITVDVQKAVLVQAKRLKALQALFLLDASPEEEFEALTQAVSAVDEAPIAPLGRPRLLLAEDDRLNQEIITKMLEQRGHRVTAVENGQKAFDALGDEPDFDVVLMDLQMPVMDGLTATASIREAEKSAGRPAVPIIGLTANATAEDVQRCIAVGMDAHVAKPIEWDALFAAIERVTARAAWAPTPRAAEPDRPGEIADPTALAYLAGILGSQRFAELLGLFVAELEALEAELDGIGDAELAKRAHKIKSSAGQMGFGELVDLCGAIEHDARQGSARTRKENFSAALRRAIAAARSSPAYERPTSPDRISPASA